MFRQMPLKTSFYHDDIDLLDILDINAVKIYLYCIYFTYFYTNSTTKNAELKKHFKSKYDIESNLGWDIKLQQCAKSDTDNTDNPSLTESLITIKFIIPRCHHRH